MMLRAVVALLLISAVCTDYVKDSILCDDIPAICENAKIPNDFNDTVCGTKTEYLNPKVCNCGYMCIGDLAEGAQCQQTVVMGYPTNLCGPGLDCLNTHVCGKNTDKSCMAELVAYETDQTNGNLGPGRYKPSCDDFGRYNKLQCSPGSTCYCVDSEGKRRFGETAVTDSTKVLCNCAIYWVDTEEKGLNGMRCLPNGDFDTLQCVDNDYCFCYDGILQVVTWGPWPFNMITYMPCYNTTLTKNPSYTAPCDKALQDYLPPSNTTIIIGATPKPVCSHDGYYAPVQRNGTHAYCVDYKGNQIEDFHVPNKYTNDMTCYCARRRSIMEESGLGGSKPKCCCDGNFFPQQVRGLLAFCVDQNGNQFNDTVPITDMTKLNYICPPVCNEACLIH